MTRNLNFTHLFLCCLAMLLLYPACDWQETPPPPTEDPRGKIVTNSRMAIYTAAEVDSLLTALEPGLAPLLNVQYGVEIQKVVYETVSWDGTPTVASGALAFPIGDTVTGFPLSSYQHGTTLRKTGVPSANNGEVVLGIIFATDGYVTAMPDFLGLGDGPGFHPYVHAESEATAVIDMLRAGRNLMRQRSIQLNGDLYLFGYSQGGHATMAAHKAIQQEYGHEFKVTASAPMAGPYDASGVQADVLTGLDPYPTPGYLPYIVWSYNMVYQIVDDPASILKSPYDTIIPPMMDGTFSIGEVNMVSNPVPRRMVKDSVMNAFESDPDHPLKLALRDNDLWNWKPESPVKMFYCQGDDQVSYMNSIVAQEHFEDRGSDQTSLFCVDPALNHQDCAVPTILFGKFYFDSLRAL